MTTGEMHGFTKRFNEIMTSVNLRERRLGNLMTDLEQAYNIPMLNNTEFNKQNPQLMQLYITVSEARTF